MSVYGIIAEYNPFHNGHLHQINIIRKNEPQAKIIAVMSGPFSQRGEPAILNKWQRAEAAVKSGINLVLELPTCFAISSAQDFAKGGVSLLRRTGCVDRLSFGAEYDDIDTLISIASASLYTDTANTKLKALLDVGKSYAQARSEAISALFKNEAELSKAKESYPEIKDLSLTREKLQSILRSPNNILAIEYLKAIRESNIKPSPIHRNLSSHSDAQFTGKYSSGSAIRKQIQNNITAGTKPYNEEIASALPFGTQIILKKLSGNDIPLANNLFRTLQYILRTSDDSAMQEIFGIREGIENRMKKLADTVDSYENFVSEMQTRRYPLASVQRLILYILLKISKENMEKFMQEGPGYARVLASDSTGFSLIKNIRQNSHLEVITKTTHFLDSEHLQHPDNLTSLQKMLALDIIAQELWSLCLPHPKPSGMDFYTSPIIIKQS